MRNVDASTFEVSGSIFSGMRAAKTCWIEMQGDGLRSNILARMNATSEDVDVPTS